MCKENVNWDDPLPNHLKPKWEKWLQELEHLNTVSIPRCFIETGFGNFFRRELHYFSDASINGYGQCTYLRQINDEGRVHCCLVIGKSRVTPLRMITIPRLELTAALLSVKISKLLQSAFKTPVHAEYFWTDSSIVLSYINNDAKRFHVFVANRVQQIKDYTTSSQWRYVKSEDNIADCASRCVKIKELQKSNWYRGPPFFMEQGH